MFAALRDTQPADTSYVVESTSTNSSWWRQMDLRRGGSYFFPASGGLGFGIPAAVGVALAQPGRPVTGVIGDDYVLNGKPVRLLDSNSGNGVAHTFSVPALGINVPLWGVPSSAKNICAHAPCSFSSVHNVITFSFRTPGPGQYHWQCLIPCGAGFLDGNGGPMQSIGYMGGFLKVVDA